MPSPGLGDWTPEEVEKNGHLVLARIREHLSGIHDVPVSRSRSPEEVRAALDGTLPREGVPFETILDDTWRSVVPNLTQWHHPSFHAYFSNSSSGPGILADTVASALNVNSMLWATSPAAAAVEEVVLRWVCRMIGYDEAADGVIVNGASLGTLYALTAARDAIPGLDVRTGGLLGRDLAPLRIYTTAQAHSSVDKAAITLGVGTGNVVRVPTGDDLVMDVAALAEAIALDRRAGFTPLAVVATDGTTATAAHDPLREIGAVCRDEDVWLHVDAAYGGLWRLVPRIAAAVPPLGVADSLVVNPHKTLFVPMECGVLLCRRRGALADAFRLVPDYLVTDGGPGVVDFMDRSLQLGRSFRALKLWWVIRSFGVDGVTARLSNLVELADVVRYEVDAAPDWQRVGDSPLPLVCVRYTPPGHDAEELDDLNVRIMNRVNESGLAYLSKTRLDQGVVLRISLGNIQTRHEDVLRLWELLTKAARHELVALRTGSE
jgi:aromatic-L-amino-acid/L-tryptophan decarboxylase